MPEVWRPLRRHYRYAPFFVNHVVGNRLRRTIRRPFLKPFYVSYHVTDRSHVAPSPLAQLGLGPFRELDLAEVLTLLKKVRKEVRMLSLTGGEPLLHPAICHITGWARRLGFAPLVLETNFCLVDEMEDVLKHCHVVVTCLESVHEGLQASRWQCDPKWVERLLKNLAHYGRLQEEFGVRIIVQGLIQQETVKEAYDLMEFCFDNQLLFAPTPSGRLSLPDRRLQGEPAYSRLVEYLIARRKAGAPILGTPESLRRLLGFEDLSCHPTLAPHLAPSGELFYPCHLTGTEGGSLLDERTLSALNRKAERSLIHWRPDWHTCRLHGYLLNTWILENFLERPLEGLSIREEPS
jgi:organic radical activating enzyme